MDNKFNTCERQFSYFENYESLKDRASQWFENVPPIVSNKQVLEPDEKVTNLFLRFLSTNINKYPNCYSIHI